MQKLKMGDQEIAAIARMMRRVELFAPLTIKQMESVLPYILLCSFPPSAVVFKQGTPGDAFYIVYEGRVSVRINKGFFSPSKEIATLKPGDFFGEMALLSKDPRAATVACIEPTKLFVLLATDFSFILKENPAFAAQMQKLQERRKFDATH